MQIAPHIHRLGADSRVNSYLLEESGEVTIVDAAMPGYYDDIPRELAAMGRSVGDVRAIVLTHGHSDHIGYAERMRRDRGVPVWIHELDEAIARGEVNPRRVTGPVSLGPLLGFLWLALRNGGLRQPSVTELSTFGDGATLDVPGSPRVILVPGHTPGSAALAVAPLDAVFVGDALATYAATNGRRGPQIAPFSADPAQALESLKRLEALPPRLVLPGHGEPWTDGIASAVAAVRAGTGK